MGGHGSGRKPDPVKRLMGFNQPAKTDNSEIYLPNLSGMNDQYKKTHTGPLQFSSGSVVLGDFEIRGTLSGGNISAGSGEFSSSGSTITHATPQQVVIRNGITSNPSSTLNSEAFGSGSAATNTRGLAVGYNASSTAANAVAVGENSSASQTNAFALGRSALASNINALAIGTSATASGNLSTALGTLASATATNSVAIGGRCASTTPNNTNIGNVASGAIQHSLCLIGADTTLVNIPRTMFCVRPLWTHPTLNVDTNDVEFELRQSGAAFVFMKTTGLTGRTDFYGHTSGASLHSSKGFTGSGSYTNFTISGGIIISAS